MDGTHPKRKKDKYNPYVLSIENNQYYIAFTDCQGKHQKMEISESLYRAFDDFELEDISHLNQVLSRCHIRLKELKIIWNHFFSIHKLFLQLI